MFLRLTTTLQKTARHGIYFLPPTRSSRVGLVKYFIAILTQCLLWRQKEKKAQMMGWDSSVGGSEMWLNSESLGCRDNKI